MEDCYRPLATITESTDFHSDLEVAERELTDILADACGTTDASTSSSALESDSDVNENELAFGRESTDEESVSTASYKLTGTYVMHVFFYDC